MKTLIGAMALLLLPSFAYAVPPTVTPSPGYDRALAESRRAREMPPPLAAEPVQRKRANRKSR